MQAIATTIPDVVQIQPSVFEDARGFFMETYSRRKFRSANLPVEFVQDNQSGSSQGTLRGLHYQIQHAQGKLVRVVVGEVFDVAVDLRRASNTFGKAVGILISAEVKNQLWIPPGFAHGFYVISEWAEVVYKVTDVYSPQDERTLLWNDPALGIEWPLVEGRPPILSEKDQRGKPLSEAEVYP